MKKLLYLLLLFVPSAVSAQRFFVQANAGFAFPSIDHAVFHSKEYSKNASSGTYGVQAGMKTRFMEFGVGLSSLKVTENTSIYVRDEDTGIPQYIIDLTVNYGNKLVLSEAFLNGRYKVSRFVFHAGISGGFAITTGNTDNTWDPEPGGKDTETTLSNGKGFSYGGQLGVTFEATQRIGIQIQGAYKMIAMDVDAPYQNASVRQYARMSLIPVTVGLRVNL